MLKIVVIRSELALSARALADRLLSDTAVKPALQVPEGATLTAKPPVPIPRDAPVGISAYDADAFLARDSQWDYAVEVDFKDADALRAFEEANKDAGIGVYDNPTVAATEAVCPAGSIGDQAAAQRQLSIRDMQQQFGAFAGDVRIAVVDTGINRGRISVVGGATGGLIAAGAAASGHGTMVALTTRLGAPQARILDYPLLVDFETPLTAVLMDACQLYWQLLKLLAVAPGPLVVVNSWALFDRRQSPPGLPNSYSSEPLHPFNRLVDTLVAGGADVLFAAGNCGGPCPSEHCGPQDRSGNGNILGANSLASVITVTAVTVHDEPLGYASSGPGSIAPEKPDLAAPSHFDGTGVGAKPDMGTSAACAVAAGVVAALRSIPTKSAVSPYALKALLQSHARQPAGVTPGWNQQTGHGIIDAVRTAHALHQM